jgi:hypothetical protein
MKTLRWLLALPLRAAAYLMAIAAVAALGRDLYLSLTAGRLVATPLGEIWFALSPQTLYLAEPAVSRYLHPVVWQQGIQNILVLPGVLALALLAALILVVARLIYRPTRRSAS